ncbi:GNAT family N-acetyltransferase [Streptomyces sp. NPDC002187]|uniref:GNAT family N-acetyltransferase n=1 Tax=Streptomyces sp. NPDC002187 TaxID=3364637 RepID=UPI00369B7888
MDQDITVRPATTGNWADVEQLLSARGSVKGCWCMFFRQTPQERRATEWGEGNRQALKALVDDGRRPGLVAYRDRTPVGWVSVAPRAEYTRLDRSPVSRAVDGRPVWSLVCLYVGKEHRGTGVARELVRAAAEYARERGARTVEAYPVDDTLGPVGADDAYHGLVSLLAREGFTEVARRTPKRPVMRLPLEP